MWTFNIFEWKVLSSSLQEQDSVPLTPTDLVFLEPRILLVDDPFAAWPQTMQTVRRIAEAIRQMMIREDVYLSTDEDHEETDWQGTIHFCDAVPVCHANSLSSMKS